MKVLVIRHSIAVDHSDAPSDDTRWLTDEGRRRMRQVSQAIVAESRPSVILTSPLTRAVQTAEILAHVAELDAVRVHLPLSLDYGTTAQAVTILDSQPSDAVVAFVSHAPKVRVLASHLTGDQRIPGFRTGSVCCAEEGRFAWWLDPEKLEIQRALNAL